MVRIYRQWMQLASVTLLIFLAIPALAALDIGRMRQSIQTSDIVPKDYREHISIMELHDEVDISVYRDPDAVPQDCAIDAILLTHKVLTSGARPKTVRVTFFDLLQEGHFWEADVNAASVSDYARGQISTSQVLRKVHLVVRQANPLTKTYRARTYKEMVDGLGVIQGPMQDQRAVALIRIDNLQSRGHDIGNLRRQYLHVEDLARRGERAPVKCELAKLGASIDEQVIASGRNAMLEALRQMPGAGQEMDGSGSMPFRAN